MKKRLLSLLLAVLMAVLLLPAEALAITGGEVQRMYMNAAPATVKKEGVDDGSQIYSLKMNNGKLVMFIATSGPHMGKSVTNSDRGYTATGDSFRLGVYEQARFTLQTRREQKPLTIRSMEVIDPTREPQLSGVSMDMAPMENALTVKYTFDGEGLSPAFLCYISYYFVELSAGVTDGTITDIVQDADGRTLYTATALGSMSSVIFSSSDIKEGETYTVLVDGASVGTATAKLGTSSSSSGSLGPDQNGGQPGSDQQNGQQGGVSGFGDVPQNSWFADAVKYVSENKLMNGESTTAFAPNENMSRAMLATVLYRMSGETAEADSGFRDVSSSAYYAAAVNWASSEGIVNGTGADAFSPNASITREQLAAMLYRYAGEPSVSADLSAYTDTVDISPYASKAVEWCVAKGILSGKSATRLAPQDTATRAECAAMLQRFAAL